MYIIIILYQMSVLYLEVIFLIKFISYIIAVMITAVIAIGLYPIALICWIFSLIGRISGGLFNFTNNTIKRLWADIGAS